MLEELLTNVLAMSTLAALAIVGGGMYYYQHHFAENPTTPNTGKQPTKQANKHSKKSDVPEGPKSGKVSVFEVDLTKPQSVEQLMKKQTKAAKAPDTSKNNTPSVLNSVLNNTSLEIDTDLKRQVAIKNFKPMTGRTGVVGMGNTATMHLEDATVVAPPVTHPPEQLPPPYRENGMPIPPNGVKNQDGQSFHHFGHPNCPENTWCNTWDSGFAESEGHALINHHCKNDPMCTKHHKSTSDSCMKADQRLAPRTDGKSWREVIPGCSDLPWYYNLPPLDRSMVDDPWFASQPAVRRLIKAEESGVEENSVTWARAVQEWNSLANIARERKGMSKTDYSNFYKPIKWQP